MLLADDDPHVQSAVRLLLEEEAGICVVGECDTAESLLERVLCSRSNAVLIDWDLPGLEPRRELRRLRVGAPSCRVVVLCGRPEERDNALRAGAQSFVWKGDDPETLLGTLRAFGADLATWPGHDHPADG